MTLPYDALPAHQVALQRLQAIGVLRIIEEAVQQHGPLVRLQFAGSEDLVILGAAEHVRFWQNHYDSFAKEISTLPSSSAVGRILLGDALTFAADGDEWRKGRRLTMPLVSPRLDTIQLALTDSAEWLVAQFQSGAVNSLRDVCGEWAVRAVMPPFMGQVFSLQESKLFAAEIHKAFFDLIQKATTSNRETLLQAPELLKIRQKMNDMVDRAIANMNNEPDTMLAALYRAMEIDQHPSQKSSLVNLVIGNLSGSIDNPATSLQWCLIHLAQHPEVQARIRQEAAGLDYRNWSIQKCPVTLAAVRECLRLTPVSSLIERTTRQRVEIEGYLLPPGVNVMFSPWLVHRNAQLWPEPLRFDIDRFLHDTVPTHHFFPFGTGKRNCVGMTLSLNQLTITLSRLALSCRWQVAASTRALDLRPQFDLNLAPRGDVALTASPLERVPVLLTP
ncbi:cytochrome P450 [Prodigiosinella confusarubida]|nr:cytochrome P450 [Serratia sp. ATCC 39006]